MDHKKNLVLLFYTSEGNICEVSIASANKITAYEIIEALIGCKTIITSLCHPEDLTDTIYTKLQPVDLLRKEAN
jgi:hypothetical protein